MAFLLLPGVQWALHGGSPSAVMAAMIRSHTSAPSLSPFLRMASTISRAFAVAVSP